MEKNLKKDKGKVKCMSGDSVQFWTHQYKTDMHVLGPVEQRALKIIKKWEHVSYEERLR